MVLPGDGRPGTLAADFAALELHQRLGDNAHQLLVVGLPQQATRRLVERLIGPPLIGGDSAEQRGDQTVSVSVDLHEPFAPDLPPDILPW